MATTIALLVLAAVLVIAGLVGSVLPGLPGAPLLFGGFFLAAFAEDFLYVGTGTLVTLGVLAVLTYGIDFLASAMGARRFGASKRAIVGAALGAVVGLFFGIPGLLLGPFVGAVLGELSAQRNLKAASRAGVGASIGLAIGAAAKLALAVAMLGIFLIARFA